MLKKLILIASFLILGKGHTKEEETQELLPIKNALESPHIYESVNVISGEYCESQTDLSLGQKLNIKRVHQSNDPLALGWFFNQPIIIEHEEASLPEAASNYEFDEKNRVTSIKVEGKWVHIQYPEKEHFYIEDSEGKRIEYHLQTSSQVRDIPPTLIDKVKYWDGRELSYEYINHPKERRQLISKRQNSSGNYLINEYYDNVEEGMVRDPRVGSVKLQKAPVGTDNTPIVTSRFYYHMGFTEVYDALNNKTIYRHGKNKKLTAIENYLGNTLYRVERFHWDNKDQLLNKILEDGSGNTVQSDQYKYDHQGNMIEHTFKGNLTGKGGFEETYTTIYRYSNDDRHLLVYHQSDNGVSVRYNYKEGTDLLNEKLTYDHGKLKEREFFTYDNNNNLIQGIRDDGTSVDPNDLRGVTERLIHCMTPHPDHKMPETIEEHYLDLKTGTQHLIKKTALVYSPAGKVIQKRIHDADGNFRFALDYEYDQNGRITKSIDAEGNIAEWIYDLEGRLIYHKTPQIEIIQDYDFVDRLIRKEIRETGKNIIQTSYRYDYNGNCISTIDLFGNEIKHLYDSLGRETQTQFSDGSSISYEFDLHDRIVSTTDAKGYSTRTVYNSRGKPTLIQYPDGTTEKFEYHLDGSLQKAIGKDGSYTLYIRDYKSRPLEINVYGADNRLLSSTKNTYNTFHQTSSTNSLGLKTEYSYDGAGRLIKTTDGHRNVEYSYDALGEIKQQKESLGENCALIITERDHNNQLKEMRIEDETGISLKKIEASKDQSLPNFDYIYGNTLQKLFINEDGSHTIITYDTMGRECSIEKRDPFGHVVTRQENQFDSVGNIEFEIHLAQGYSLITAYRYGPCNRIESVTEAYGTPRQQTTLYSYNSAGQLEILTKPDGISLHYSYLPGGTLGELRASDNSFHYRYHYDSARNAILVENLTDGSSTKRIYNSSNQLIQETLSNGLTLNYQYDSRGRRTELSLPDASKVTYEYDAAYLKTIHRLSASNEYLYSHHYDAYDLQGHLTKQNLIGSLGKITLSYDQTGKYIGQNSDYYDEKISYDSNNRPVTITTLDGMNTYSYDTQNQLIQEEGIHNHRYEYDFLRNRISKNDSIYTVNQQNELLAVENSHYAYDSNGNRVEHNETQYAYDALNRLVSVSQNGFKVTYAYDPFGRRISKTINNQTFRYIYEGENEIGCVNELGKIVEFRALGEGKGGEIGAAVAIELDGKIYAPIHDSRGSTQSLIDITTGKAVSTSSYSAFGEEKTSGEVLSPWRYSGKRIDDETGLIFFGKRYYDPNTGRWITKDPLGMPEGPNRYAYVLNNPMTYTDSYGLFSLSDLIRSFWEGLKTFKENSIHSFDVFKHHLSFTEYIRPHFDQAAQQIIGRTTLHLAGFYEDASECGVHGKGELHDKVRITLINGILNARIDYKKTIDYLSESHGGINVHYVFDATEGWSWDIFKAIAAKFGYVSTQAHMLADTWRKMIEEMGGVNGNGLVIHFAHSVGGTHTKAALSLMTPEELKMIRIITIGSASLFSHPDLESVTNFVSKRDGVPYLDPIGYIQGFLGISNNTIFIGSWLGVPFVDHTLASSTYLLLIELLGKRFMEEFFLYS